MGLLTIASVLSLFVSSAHTHATNIVARDLSQTAQLPGLTFDLPDLPNPTRSVQQIEGIPEDCAAYLGEDKECTSNMLVADITFEDCGNPFRMCHCNNANITMDEAVDFLAHVPVGLRRHVGTVMVMPDTSAHAYTYPTSGEIHFFGVCSQRTWIHEATHAADGALGITANGDSSDWGVAVAGDTCVPDTYAKSNLVEDFAQVSVVELYRLLSGDNSLPDGLELDCMKNQMDYISSLDLYNPDTLFGNTCALQSKAR